jgi:hypothetical protein
LQSSIFSIIPIALPLPNKRCVQNTIAFLLSALGMASMKAEASFAGLEPSTGNPMIKRSKFPMADGCVAAMSKIGAFVVSAIACAKRLVFPVLEKKTTQAFMVQNSAISADITFDIASLRC